jgi:two-component system response regulator PilR (NtrC family)
MAALCAYDFPGNVRELENIIERATIIETGDIIEPGALPLAVARAVPASPGAADSRETLSTILVTPGAPADDELTNNVSPVSGDPDGLTKNGTIDEAPEVGPSAGEVLSLDAEMDRLERELLGKALERTRGNKTEAAKLLGISFRSLRYRLDKHGLD